MKGYKIERCNNERGWDAPARGVYECKTGFYVLASSPEEALNLVQSEFGKRIKQTFSSLEELKEDLKHRCFWLTRDDKDAAIVKIDSTTETTVIVEFIMGVAA